jgi:hypothetical protein
VKYVLMFWVDESAPSSQEEDAALLRSVASWLEKMKQDGIFLHGGPLRSAGEGVAVRVSGGDEVLISDGPFAETREQVGGYAVAECADMDAAIGVASAHPLAKSITIEVRPFWEEAPFPIS